MKPSRCGKTFCPRRQSDNLCETCLLEENGRLRDLLAFNGINPNAQVSSARGARFAYGRLEQ